LPDLSGKVAPRYIGGQLQEFGDEGLLEYLKLKLKSNSLKRKVG